MTPPEIAYSVALMVAGITCLMAGLIILQTRRNALGALPLTILMLALSWWDLTYSLFWADAPAPFPNFWLYITYVGAVTVPAALLTFAMQLSGMDDWLKRPFVVGLCIEPVLVLALLFTDPWHGLFFAGKQTQNIGMIGDAGPVFWANVVYSYLLILIGFIILFRRFLQTSGIYKQQISVVLIGAGIPWLNNLIFIFGLSPFPNADNTPFSFTIAGLAFTYALLRYRLLDILPIARHVLIENMSDGVLVLDARNRLVDINPAAGQVLDSPEKSKIGAPVEIALSAWSDVVKAFYEINNVRTEVPIGDPPRSYLDLKISPLYDGHRSFIGRLVVWRDITPLKKAQAELRELATKDALTETFNRRYFLEAVDREIARANRFSYALAVILLDFDRFKYINDTFGHLAGDRALKIFADICRGNIREVDLFARFGGDEFVALLPEADHHQAREIAERMLQALTQLPIDIGVEKVSVTVSMGISGLIGENDTAEAILHRADQALYNAKESGRNRIVVWSESILSPKH